MNVIFLLNMKVNDFFKSVLQEFNKQNIGYAVLRNYEFLLENKYSDPGDFDVMISSEDFYKAEKIFYSFGFVKNSPQFSLKHRAFSRLVDGIRIGFDTQKGGIHWNDNPYLIDKQVLKRKKKIDFFYTLSDEDAFIMYLCHSVLGKRRFKPKYKNKILELNSKKLDRDYIYANLSNIFSNKLASEILKLDFNNITKKSKYYAFRFVIKNFKRSSTFFFLFFRWFFGHQKSPLRKIPFVKFFCKSAPMISFMGPDGSGKSTNAKRLVQLLRKNGYRSEYIYSGRGGGNILPINKISSAYKKKEKSSTKFKPLIYTLAAPIYALDILVRYFLKIFPKRKNYVIVVTDRFGSDMLLMKYVPLFFRKFLLLFFPKPTLTFYLYNDVDVLHKRRKHPKDDLIRQFSLFPILNKRFNSVKIKTSEFDKDFGSISNTVVKTIDSSRY